MKFNSVFQAVSQRDFEFVQLLLQVFFVGMTVGLFRTVIPALAETEFGVPRDSFILLATFIAVFGLIKASLNFVAGSLSDAIGRRKVLMAGWLTALPIPYLLAYAPNWSWVIAATVLLSINQGLCWSMSQVMKLDLSDPRRHGAAMGFNETFGYCGVALSGYLSAWMTARLGMAETMVWLGFSVIGSALLLASLFCRETKPGSSAASSESRQAVRKLIFEVSWSRRSTMALCLAGSVEKFVDTLVWLIYPVFLYQRGVSLVMIGVITGVYGGVWGITQLFTGSWSDRIGRKPFIVGGMILCAVGCSLTLLSMAPGWWIFNAALTGLGMAMLYPNLGSAVNDQAPLPQRGTILGIYRFWRDFGYFAGAVALSGVITLSGFREQTAFLLTTAAMLMSALAVVIYTPETYRLKK